jgi:competence transcription factor ComK
MAGLIAVKSKAREGVYINPQHIISVEQMGNGSTKITLSNARELYSDDPIAQVVSDINDQMALG